MAAPTDTRTGLDGAILDGAISSPGTNQITVRRAGLDDVDVIVETLCTVFNSATHANTTALIEEGGLCLLAIDALGPVAVATARVVEDPASALPYGQQHLAAELGWSGRTGIVQKLCVVPRVRRHGLCSTLVAEHLDWMRGRGAVAAFSDAWIYADGRIPASGPLRDNGFVEVGRFEQFWRLDSIERDYGCSQCGRPCRCSAAVYYRKLEGEGSR